MPENDMLNALTYGLGAELGKKIRIAYFEKERVLNRHEVYREFHIKQRQLYLDLLALSVFYQYAIGPLHGSVEFMNNTKKYGVKSIGMGTYKFDSKMKKISSGITSGFFSILEKYEIEVTQLLIGSTAEFIENNKKWVLRATNG